jgi:AcrR family transcriptional regulator
VPSENVSATERPGEGDRRTRKRAARRDHLLELALDLVDAHGVEGLTMAKLAEAADYAPASLYTYFPSRSALVAAVQEGALQVLAQVGRASVASWEHLVAAAEPSEAALARLLAFSDLFLAAPARYRREFRLQQQLLVTPGVEEAADAGAVVPAAMAVLAVPQGLLATAAEVGALRADDPPTDPLGGPVDPSLARTLAWVVALNGALQIDGLVTGLPTTGVALGGQITEALLVGWGADPRDLARARVAAGPLIDRSAELAQEDLR